MAVHPTLAIHFTGTRELEVVYDSVSDAEAAIDLISKQAPGAMVAVTIGGLRHVINTAAIAYLSLKL